MISCAEAREELVAALRGETSPETARAVERHVERCASCAAERDSLVRTMDVLREHVHPELSADARMRLRSALDAELASHPPHFRRRLLIRAAALPLAFAAGAAVALLAAPVQTPSPPADAVVARAARPAADAELGTLTSDAVSRGLAWLAARQGKDGAWSPSADAPLETTAAVTATALLAFEADRQTPYAGPRRAALRRARNRLAQLVADGFSKDPDAKPVYAQALSVRALAAEYRLDHEAMATDERRELRELLGEAGRRLVEWQGVDGGYGYAAHAPRSDSSCTLFAVAALAELRSAGIMDPDTTIDRAGRFLASLQGPDGTVAYMHPGDRRGAPALTAALLALDVQLGTRSAKSERALLAIEQALAKGDDALLAWTGAEALARHGRPLEAPARRLLAAQREDGAWTAAPQDRHCASAGDAVTTAFGVLALAQVRAR